MVVKQSAVLVPTSSVYAELRGANEAFLICKSFRSHMHGRGKAPPASTTAFSIVLPRPSLLVGFLLHCEDFEEKLMDEQSFLG